MGRNAVLRLFLPHHIGVGISQRPVHPSPSGRLEDSVRPERDLPLGDAVPPLPGLRHRQKVDFVVRPRSGRFSHQHGQGVRCELLGYNPGTCVESRGRVRRRSLSRMDVQGYTHPAHGHFVGDQFHVGDYRDSFRSLAAKFQGVLVGCPYFRCASLQWIGDLVWAEDLQDIGDAGVQMGGDS